MRKGGVSGKAVIVKRLEKEFDFILNRKFANPPKRTSILGILN